MKKTFLVLILMINSMFALAGPGHDHGDESPAVEGQASPRVVMESDIFEAVGILNGKTLEIFIDHAATNAPAKNAEVALLLNGEKVPVELHAEGEFDAVLPESMAGKNIDIAMRVTAGDQNDVLTGQLVLPDSEHAHGEDEHDHLMEYIAMGGLVLLLLGFVALFLKRRANKGVN